MTRVFATLGVATLGLVWLGPLPRLASSSFSAHMAMHMGVVAVASPLLAIGLAGGGWDPVRLAPRWFAAIPASIAELVVVWAWHTPMMHHWARHHFVGFVAEQATFFACGVWLWSAAFGGAARERTARSAAGLVALLLTSMHMTLLGALLALATRPLYLHPSAQGHLSPLSDQHLGGAIMLLVGGIAYLAGGLALGLRLLRSRR